VLQLMLASKIINDCSNGNSTMVTNNFIIPSLQPAHLHAKASLLLDEEIDRQAMRKKASHIIDFA
jgi:hypothetical protein